MQPEFKRIMLKLSGEGLAGENKTGTDAAVVQKLATEIKTVHDMGVQICLVIGGGNIFRGAKNGGAEMDRSVADQIGMLATVMNALTMKAVLENIGCPAKVFSALAMPQICETYNFREAVQTLDAGCVAIFACGTGSPYFTTDTGAVLRAVEMHCDIMMKATQVDGVYSADPRYDSNAKRYDAITYDEVLEKSLNVMDMTAIAMARDNKLPVMIFMQKGENSIINAVCGKAKCTIIK